MLEHLDHKSMFHAQLLHCPAKNSIEESGKVTLTVTSQKLCYLTYFYDKFRAYRSVQPAEKGRSNSVDGSLPGLDRRHASLSPVISSPDPFAPQQFDVPSEDNSASCSPPPISYSHNETGDKHEYDTSQFLHCT